MHASTRLFAATVGWLTLAASAAPSQAASAPAPETFALVPPAAVAGLAAQRQTAVAADLLKTASGELAATPRALPRLHTEGTLPHQGIYDESKAANGDFDLVLDLAVAYRLTTDPRYLKAADNYLSAWASVYRVGLNPIDETRFDLLFAAYDVVKADLPAETREKVIAWLQTFAGGYAKQVVEKQKDTGNWQSHRVKLLTLAAFALGDERLIVQAHAAFSQHVRANVRADGSVEDFYKRDALHYVVYDLQPLATACLAARGHGQNWFDENAPASVAAGVDWLLPYATGQKTHVEFVHSKVGFDRARADAGVPGFGPHPWAPDNSVKLLTFAAALDPARRAVCEQVSTATKQAPPPWLVLLFWPKPTTPSAG